MASEMGGPRRQHLVEALLGVALALGSLAVARSAPDDVAAPSRAAEATATTTVRYELVARLDSGAHSIEGKGRIHWRNDSRIPQRELWVHLYLNAFRAGSIWNRDQIGGFRGGGRPSSPGQIRVTRFEVEGMGELWPEAAHTPGDPRDETDIRVPLKDAVAPGATIAIDVAFTAQLPNVVMRTGFAGSFHMVAQWFPKLARLEPDGTWRHFPFHRLSEFYADFGTYDVTIDVPQGFVVGATGTRKEETLHGGRLRQRYEASRVHDFAFTAWDGFEVIEREGPDGVALRCLFPAGERAIAEIELDEAAAALPRLAQAYGPYPYPALTIVHPPAEAREAGGMEYPMLITTGGQDFFGVRALASVTVHELAHQWFYGLVASDEHRFPFLDEGLTTYATTRALEARYPDASAFEGLGLSIGHAQLSRAAAAERWNADPIAQPSAAFLDGRDYGWLVYQRTATLLETLRRVYGDEAMARAMALYARRFRFAHPTPEDLLDTFGEVLGEHAREQLRRGLFERGFVDYAIVSTETRAGGDGYETRVVVRRHGEIELPVDVVVRARDGQIEQRRWNGESASAAFVVTTGAAFESVSIDPEVDVPLDHDLRNNHRHADPMVVAPRLLAVTGALWSLVMGLAAP